jgi:hypothetical protein
MTARTTGGGRRLRTAGLLVILTALLALPAVARAQTAVVPAFPCAVIFGGQWTVPAGSDVVVAQRWEAKYRGLVEAFLNAQTTTLSINGAAPLDISGEYVPISAAAGGTYFTRVAHDTGITLGAGDTLTFTVVISFSHRVLDGFTLADETSHRPLFFGPGVAFEFPCEVTGA